MKRNIPSLKKKLFLLLVAAAIILPLPAFTKEKNIRGEVTPAATAALMEKEIPLLMKKHHVPGVVFILVQRGRITWQKGFGFADIEKKKPVDPEKTLFRVASNSKLFVATAVMQLAEGGKIDLSEDVNVYLKDFKVLPLEGEPVTMKNLLTHTAGFDDTDLGTAVLTREEKVPLAVFLERRMPRRVFLPGKVTSYSNYGYALAGHIVASVSGMPFHEYVKKNILTPLGMNRSRFLVEPGRVADLATPYLYRKGDYEVLPVEYDLLYPASSLVTSGGDMARFMAAHLQKGQLGNVRILKKETAEAMHRQQFSNHPALPGIGMAFIEGNHPTTRILKHGGWVAGFKSQTILFPEHDTGIFLAYNLEYMMGAAFELVESVESLFMERFFPGEKVKPAKSGDKKMADAVAGFYRNNRLSRALLSKMAAILNDIRIVSADDGTILMKGKKYYPRPGYTFLREDGGEKLAFRRDASGRVTHLFMDGFAAGAFDRLTWHDTALFHFIITGMSVIFLIAAGIFFLVLLLRKKYSSPGASRLMKLGILESLLVPVITVGIIIVMLGYPQIAFLWSLPPLLYPLLVMGLVIAVTGLLYLALLINWWRQGGGYLHEKIMFLLTGFSLMGYCWFLYYWNLLGFKTG